MPIGAAIFLLALAIRLVYFFQSADAPSFAVPVVDADVYDTMARHAAAGNGINYNRNFFWQSPFYPVFLSLIYFFSNGSIVCAKLIQALLGCLCCLLTWQLGRKIFSRAVGITAGVITAAYGPLIFLEQELLATGWATFWALALLLVLIKAENNHGRRPYFLVGLVGALSVLTRPTFLLFFSAATVWLAVRLFRQPRPGWRPFSSLAALLAGFAMIALPAALINLHVTGHFGILPATGGINFFVGNNPDPDQTISARPGREWTRITQLPAQNGRPGDMWEDQRYFSDRVLDYVLTQPVAFVRGLGHKTVQIINSREIPRNIDVYLFGQWSGLLKLLVWKVRGLGFPFGLLLPLSLLGLIAFWRQTPVPVKLFVLFYPLSLVLVFVAGRYRVPLVPVMAILAAAGLLKLIDLTRRRDWQSLALTAAGFAAVVAAATRPGPFPQEKTSFEAELYANVAARELDLGRTAAAITHLEKALSLKPDYPSASGNLGVALTRAGRIDEALGYFETSLYLDENAADVHNNLATALAGINRTDLALAHYRQAVSLRPFYAEAHYNLGNLLLAGGQIKEAIHHLHRSVEIRKDFYQAHNSLAVALTRRGDIDQAVHHFNRAIDLRPDDPEARYNLAVTLAGYGRTSGAIKAFRELIDIAPPSPRDMVYLARLLIADEDSNETDIDEAILLAQEACRQTGYRQPRCLDALAQAHAAAGNMVQATDAAQTACRIAADENDPDTAYYRRMLAMFETGGPKRVKED